MPFFTANLIDRVEDMSEILYQLFLLGEVLFSILVLFQFQN